MASLSLANDKLAIIVEDEDANAYTNDSHVKRKEGLGDFASELRLRLLFAKSGLTSLKMPSKFVLQICSQVRST